MRKYFSIIAVSSLFASSITANAGVCPFELNKSFASVDETELRKFVANLPLEKSKFETSEKFIKRQEEYVASFAEGVLIVATKMDKDQIDYVADNEFFYFDDYFFSNGRYGPSTDFKAKIFGLEDKYDALDLNGIAHRILEDRIVTGSYSASTVGGASLTVEEVSYTNVIVFGDHVVDKNRSNLVKHNGKYFYEHKYYGYEPVELFEAENILGDLKLEPYHILPYSIEKAEAFYEGVATFTAIKIKEPFFFVDTETLAATFDLPEERRITNVAIRADIICSALADGDGNVAQILTPLSEAYEYQTEM